MRVFNEETASSSNQEDTEVIVVLRLKEVRSLIEALEASIKINKRKKTWKRLYDKLYTGAACS
jgi:hypothetical protein